MQTGAPHRLLVAVTGASGMLYLRAFLKVIAASGIEGSLAIINNCLNPYTTPVTEDMVRMVQGE